jgi:hypothetical protein
MAKERLCERDAIRGRGDPSRTSTNREAKSSTGLAREWKRRGRIRHLRAKPAGIWAKASKKKRGDREVESTINAWGLLLSGQKATDRNRRVSSPLSPIFCLFLSPSGRLYQKVQHLLAEGGPPPAVIKHRRPGPKQPADGLPASEWPTVLCRVVEQKEPLRTVAAAYGVSHETIRRLLLHLQKPLGQQEA